MKTGHSAKNNGPLLTYAELQHAIDFCDNPGHEQLCTAANFLLNAVTDWPEFDLKEPIDLVASLHVEINGLLTFDTLLRYAKVIDDPWKKEALNALLELFDLEQKNVFDSTVDLETVIFRLTQQYRTAVNSAAASLE